MFDNGIGYAFSHTWPSLFLAHEERSVMKKTTFSLSAFDRSLLTGLFVVAIALEASARGEIVLGLVSDFAPSVASQDSYSPGYLAQRLGVAQKSTTLLGVPVREKNGRKIGKLEDVILDLHSGRVMCALVSAGGGATLALPGKIFYSAGEKEARLTMSDVNLDAVPHAANADIAGLVNSLPKSYKYFSQQIAWDSAQVEPKKCSELVGLNVRNNAGESLGHVVNLIVDVPTARVIFVVVSLSGKADDLYVVPPTALQSAADNSSLVLNVDKAKISALAHSDGFFWSNMADANWCAEGYHAFGKQADFDSTPNASQVPTHADVQASSPSTEPAPRNDGQLAKDILAALMLDSLDNPFIFKHAKIKPANGQVTLSGWVKSQDQRTKLVSIAANVAGAANVHDELQIK
jgi:sporulation protein YlmC with PRC-barrel domain